VEELKEAMRANRLQYSDRVLSETLNALANRGMVRRWNNNTGLVYILAEEKSLSSREEAR
jgi:DNA-binding HxlR family transcriptional regulator